MTWAALLVLAAGAYALKAVGPLGLGGRTPSERLTTVLGLAPPALLGALVAVQTFAGDGRLVLDARAAGLAAAAVAVLLRAPFLVVIGVAAASTAAVRALG